VIFTAENTIKSGRRVRRVIDGNGFDHWSPQVVSVDTDTGEIVSLRFDASGSPELTDVNGFAEIAKDVVLAPLPVTLLFHPEHYPPTD
jgi:hypothetical protein